MPRPLTQEERISTGGEWHEFEATGGGGGWWNTGHAHAVGLLDGPHDYLFLNASLAADVAPCVGASSS